MTVGIRMLGGVEVELDGRPAALGHTRQQHVFAALAIDVNAVVPVDELVDRVWGEQSPQRATGTLQSYLTRLRNALPGLAIVRRSGGYALLVDDPLTVDVRLFEHLVDRARTTSAPERAVELFEQALQLWRGEALAGLDSPWAVATRELLDRQLFAAELDVTDLRLQLGRHGVLVPELVERAAAHPLDERAAGQLMLALYRTGRQAEALAHYEAVRGRLATELGADPGVELRQLHQRILTANPVLAVPARPADQVVPRQLPAPPTGFAGRADELAALSEALADTGGVPIAVIVGNGGIGKTALALRWAHLRIEDFPDGQLHVNLRGFDPSAPPVTPSTAVRGFLGALGVEPRSVPADPDAQAALYRSRVAGRRLLVVLDNAADVAQVEPLLPGSPGCAVIVTSRNRLAGLVTKHGARPLIAGILDDSEARALLDNRVGVRRLAAEPDAVAEILALCGGFPLALSIAAGRAQIRPGQPLAVLADELRDASTRLGVLDEDDPGSGVTAMLSCSFDTLTADQARVFTLLGLVPGDDIDLHAAASLAGLPAGRTAQALRDLEQRSLVSQDSPGRWRMHDLVRLYAANRAEDPEAALRRVVVFYARSAQAGNRVLDPSFPVTDADEPIPPGCQPLAPSDPMAWFDEERRCLLAAQRIALEHGWHLAAFWLAEGQVIYYYRRGRHHDNLALWQAGAAAAEHLGLGVQGVAHRQLGRAHSRLHQLPEAIDELNRALAVFEQAGDLGQLSRTHQAMALVLERRSDDLASLDHATKALDLALRIGHRLWEGEMRNLVSWYLARLGKLDVAHEEARQALEVFRELDDRAGEADTLDSLGLIAERGGRHADAVDHFRRSIEMYRELGNFTVIAGLHDRLGRALLGLGDRPAARRAWEHALAQYHEQRREADVERMRDQLAELD
ncbi:AfsR/SARP family transcriptional regulator [Kutzneria kofuensis]|uniref:DNA-binding SARP family transcriptional activator/tetratricopeptide (TPR) repeat protein n=1 Tax=Kutzneria kofuensis TaxID=103725 RepID=A0A7W9NJH0_9PSEU|nr:BTAD domain-containing putative transcriptional regulator [Kutzneria kofuensis]MBB5894950.1 DNA-binding SARP family transcriptional activator/tetratricopeptide (TPR) repeat protein [Kutzneria kofuensis]